MKKAHFLSLLILFVAGCKKSVNSNNGGLEGGTGGPYGVAVFSRVNGVGVSSTIGIRYGANTMAADSSFNSRKGTMVEPGFGPHAHFGNLKKGTYYIFAKTSAAKADTVVVLGGPSHDEVHIFLDLK